jgi:predicted enzyme related to lactoylglutathione lyase
VVGQQFGGRVGLFLRVDDFDVSYERMINAGVRFVSPPRAEMYGKVAVFVDLERNRWDLLGPDLLTKSGSQSGGGVVLKYL